MIISSGEKKNYFQVKFLFILLFTTAFALGQESPVLTLSIPYQNSLLYNRFLVNPTFSFVGENDRNISMFSRSQWIAFSDAPKVYQLNYSGRFSERTGFGISLYQQTLGVITSFGGIGNGAYYVPFNEDMGLTVGSNIVFYSSGVDMSKVDVENTDPLLLSLDNRSLLSLHPGMNFNYKRFDVGFFAENLVNFDFGSNAFVKNYAETTFSGHLMYTYFMENEGATLRTLFRARNNKTFGFNSGLSAIANFPSWGWVQSGFDTYFGVAIGVGFHISKKLSVGYIYEKTSRLGMQNFGASHEFNLVFTLGSEENSKPSEYREPKTAKKSTASKASNEGKPKKQTELKPTDDEFDYIVNGSVIENMILIPEDILDTDEGSDKQNQIIHEIPDSQKVNEVQPPPSVIAGSVENMDEREIKKVFSKKTEHKRNEPDNIGEIIVPSVNSGYYVIAGVFSKTKNVKRMILDLHNRGIEARSFINPENNYQCVYLRYYNTRKEALAAYYSNVDDTYFDTIWILKVVKN